MNTLDFLISRFSPSDTKFIGRDAELEITRKSLQSARLVTLTGSGGCGKTRLALEAAAQMNDVYSDHIWWVDLAQLPDPVLLPGAVARAAGVRQEMGRSVVETLTQAPQLQYGLLVLDNCDHLMQASARLIGQLLKDLPDLKILATCREPLHVPGEYVLRVPPLALSSPDESSPRRLMVAEAVHLFAERARLVAPAFILNDANIHAVAEICRYLEGLPLPIELVVAHVNFLTVEQISVRLRDQIIDLAGGKHRLPLPHNQTVRAAIDWSYQRLPANEQWLLRRLAVFFGGWTPEAAQAVCAGAGPNEALSLDEIKKLLKRLAGRALLRSDLADGSRYRMLWPVREFALERLEEAGETEKIRDRHLEYYLGIAERAEPHLLYADYVPTLDQLEEEFPNLRVAFNWALDSGRTETGLFMASVMQHLWIRHGYFYEGAAWLEGALASGPAEPSLARVKAYFVIGRLERFIGQYDAARSHLAECVRQAQVIGDETSLAEALTLLGQIAAHDGQFPEAYRLVNQALALQRRLGFQTGMALSLDALGAIAQVQGDYEKAEAYYEEGLALTRQAGNLWRTGILLRSLGQVARRRANYGRAQALLREALILSQTIKDPWNLANCLLALGGLAVDTGAPDRGAILFGAAEKMSETLGSHLDFAENLEYQHDLAALRIRIDQETLTAAWYGGRTMQEDHMIKYAVSGPELAVSTPEAWTARLGEAKNNL
jgi:non-specific serine/threonine protein kinase